jgi:GNAT superfamily N-acetyltransferase
MTSGKTYRIIDPDKKNLKSFFVCLEDDSPDMKEAGNHKECWYNKLKSRGLGVKLAVDMQGRAVGMIQYIPSEYSLAGDQGFYFVSCIWIPRRKSRSQNYRHMGMGRALLKSAEKDVKQKGASAMLAWGVSLPFFIKASWYKKQGYRVIDHKGIQVLLWKPFLEGLTPPRWIPQTKKPQAAKHPGKVTVSVFLSGGCPVGNIHYERVKRAAEDFPGKVVIETIDTLDKDTIAEWGITDAVYVEDNCISWGPPQAYEKIRAKLAHAVRKIKV